MMSQASPIRRGRATMQIADRLLMRESRGAQFAFYACDTPGSATRPTPSVPFRALSPARNVVNGRLIGAKNGGTKKWETRMELCMGRLLEFWPDVAPIIRSHGLACQTTFGEQLDTDAYLFGNRAQVFDVLPNHARANPREFGEVSLGHSCVV